MSFTSAPTVSGNNDRGSLQILPVTHPEKSKVFKSTRGYEYVRMSETSADLDSFYGGLEISSLCRKYVVFADTHLSPTTCSLPLEIVLVQC